MHAGLSSHAAVAAAACMHTCKLKMQVASYKQQVAMKGREYASLKSVYTTMQLPLYMSYETEDVYTILGA